MKMIDCNIHVHTEKALEKEKGEVIQNTFGEWPAKNLHQRVVIAKLFPSTLFRANGTNC